MKKDKELVSFIIPALNEEKAIKKVIKEVPIKKLEEMGYGVEIVIVDNGSTDRTGHIAKKNGATVFVQPVRGYGNAYKAGFANAHGDIIVTGDADCTYPFEDVPGFIALLESRKLDFINTDRLSHLRHEAMSWTHRFGNWFLATICKMLWWDYPFHDSQSGMWIFRKKIWSKLHVKASGMPFSQELKIEAYKKGFKCDEIKIDYRPRVGDVKLDGWKDAVKNTIHLFVKKLGLIGF